MVKPRHIPIRTCVACRNTSAKRGLLRVVRQADGSVAYDRNGKMPGRGAYVCAEPACIALARKQKKLERSLKAAAIPEELYRELESQTEQQGPVKLPLPDLSAAVSLPSSLPGSLRTPVIGSERGPDTRAERLSEDERAGVCGARPQESEE